MIFFFGTRSTKVKERQLKRTTCPYCNTQDSFKVTTYSKYFHFFWIPIIPLFKTNVAECTHCKKTYAQGQFTPDMRTSLERENHTDPAKRPIWQGCGCLVLTVFFITMFSISFYGVYMRSKNPEAAKFEKDDRKQLLEDDMSKLTKLILREKDTFSFALKECVDYDIVGGLDTKDIEYFTKRNNKKLLVLLRIENIKKIKPEFRKDILDVLTDCFYQIDEKREIDEFYIGVEGKWNTVLVKTPTDEDTGGRFADKYKLLPFYGEQTYFNISGDTLESQ